MTPDTARTVVHIGYHKTASTWLQRFVFPAWQPLLDQRGVRIDSSEGYSGDIFSDDLDRPRAMRDAGGRTGVVVVLRSQHTALPSLYWLYVKGGGTLEPEDFLHRLAEGGKYFYADLVEAYADCLGTENLLVLLYEDLCDDPSGFLSRLARFCGLDPDRLPQPLSSGRTNTSPSRRVVETARLFNLNAGRADPADGRGLVKLDQAQRRRRQERMRRAEKRQKWLARLGLAGPARRSLEMDRDLVDGIWAGTNRRLQHELNPGPDLCGRGYPGI